jgi:hypothetical protein
MARPATTLTGGFSVMILFHRIERITSKWFVKLIIVAIRIVASVIRNLLVPCVCSFLLVFYLFLLIRHYGIAQLVLGISHF